MQCHRVAGDLVQEDLMGAMADVVEAVDALAGSLEDCGVGPEARARCLPRIESALEGTGGAK